MDQQHRDYYAQSAALEEHRRQLQERERIDRQINERWPEHPKRIDILFIVGLAIGAVVLIALVLWLS